MKIARHQSGFTLVEMLTVIAIVAILAALVVPALKNVGNGNATVSATRQLVDDVGRARQLAISRHTTVYMVFVPTNFWINLPPSFPPSSALTNLADEQLTGYTFMAYGAVGDQPGQHLWHYLAPWQTLPGGTFIAQWKFYNPAPPLYFTDPINALRTFSISQFDYTNAFPFPAETNSPGVIFLPYIAFNYTGQLVSSANDLDFAGSGEDIPLARGSVAPAIDPATKTLQFGSPDVTESPPGNSTNIYNIVHIDWLTGRARLEQQKVQ